MIALMDCNNFFVSCERLFRPDLLKRPVAVLSSNDGCIVSRSQEVKDLGIPMGIPYFKVKEICEKEGVILFSSNFTLYRDISTRVMETLSELVGTCEVYSIDEAFFTVSDSITKAELISLRDEIAQRVGVPVSIGAGKTKTLAKQASALGKKGEGAHIMTHENWEVLARETPCSSVWGLGRATSAALKKVGVETVAEFLALDRAFVRSRFGVGGERIYQELQGVQAYEVEGNTDVFRQSLTSSRSFAKTTSRLSDLESAVGYHVSELGVKLRERGLLASRMVVSIAPSRHGDFLMHRGVAEVLLQHPSNETAVLLREALAAMRQVFDPQVPYKKAGVVIGGLLPLAYQTEDLFSPTESKNDTRGLDSVVDALNARFGHRVVQSAIVKRNGTLSASNLRSKEYTTLWKDIPTVQAK
jgi:DNA polymerase V